ncbi:hypothetical protein [Alsobacter sp. R-9]
MTMRYRTTGAWGAGIGANLTAAQIDENFYTLWQKIAEEIAALDSPVGISNIVQTGLSFTVILSDATELGPFTLTNPQVPQGTEIVSATHTLVSANANRYLRCTALLGCDVTVPADLDVPLWTEFHFRAVSASMSFTADSGVTINTPVGYLPSITAVGGTATLKKVGTDEYDLFGLLTVDVSA